MTSAAKVETLPPAVCEIALIGRSNVGKSSLVNALANQKQLAKVSKTPGRTQLINQFALPDGTTVVDLPGYGYANAPKQARATWGRMTERYLLERDGLELILVLVDGEVGPTKLDIAMFEWLRDHDLRFAVIATKHDKVKSSQRQSQANADRKLLTNTLINNAERYSRSISQLNWLAAQAESNRSKKFRTLC